MKNIHLLCLSLGLFAAQPLLADTAPTASPSADSKPLNIGQRMQLQARRIRQGLKSGALSKSDAADLRADHEKIQAEIKAGRTANGGTLTDAQRQTIQGELNAENDKIVADEQKNGAPAPTPTKP
jgi:hypothetical protein